jgi:hypothetical protein
MFLANSFPLGERSGVNLRGDFNTNMIHYDSDEEVNADPNMTGTFDYGFDKIESK